MLEYLYYIKYINKYIYNIIKKICFLKKYFVFLQYLKSLLKIYIIIFNIILFNTYGFLEQYKYLGFWKRTEYPSIWHFKGYFKHLNRKNK